MTCERAEDLEPLGIVVRLRTVVFSVRLRAEVARAVAKEAKGRGLTVSAYLSELVERRNGPWAMNSAAASTTVEWSSR